MKDHEFAEEILKGLVSATEGSLELPQIHLAFMEHPWGRQIKDIMLKQVFGQTEEDTNSILETIKEMRRIRNQAIYVDWSVQTEEFLTPLAHSDEAQDRLVRARSVVATVQNFLDEKNRISE